MWFLTVTCSSCPYLYFGSAIMLVIYFNKLQVSEWPPVWESCSFGLPWVPFVNCCQFMYLFFFFFFFFCLFHICVYTNATLNGIRIKTNAWAADLTLPTGNLSFSANKFYNLQMVKDSLFFQISLRFRFINFIKVKEFKHIKLNIPLILMAQSEYIKYDLWSRQKMALARKG